MRSVATNKFQKLMKEQRQAQLAPSPWVEKTAPCIIVKIFDTPTDLHAKQKADGRLFARVRTAEGAQITLPLRMTADELLGIGNSDALRGRRGIIYYKNGNLRNGHVVLAADPSRRNADVKISGRQLTIGGILV